MFKSSSTMYSPFQIAVLASSYHPVRPTNSRTSPHHLYIDSSGSNVSIEPRNITPMCLVADAQISIKHLHHHTIPRGRRWAPSHITVIVPLIWQQKLSRNSSQHLINPHEFSTATSWYHCYKILLRAYVATLVSL